MRYLYLLSIVLIFSSCTYDNKTPSDNQDVSSAVLNIPDDFDFSTHRTIDIKINDIENNVVYKVYGYSNDFEEEADAELDADEVYLENLVYKKLLTASTFNNEINHKINLPKEITSLLLVRNANEGFHALVAIVGNQVSLNYTGNDDFDSNNTTIAESNVSQNLNNNQHTNAVTYNYMGTYSNYWGVPDYLVASDVIHDDLLNTVFSSLPERQPVPIYNPEYIASGVETDVKFSGLSEIWVTFVHEAAGYKNALAYYTYDVNNPPASADEIGVLNIILPNASFQGSGGGLYSGNKVYLGQFDSTTAIGWAIIANGWKANQNIVSQSAPIYYSNPDFNPEMFAPNRRHNVILTDNVRDLLLIGFEDLNRDSAQTDDDFNDLVFYVTATPYTNVIKNDYEVANQVPSIDSDSDGVNDNDDAYPNDGSKAFQIFSPSSSGKSTLAFEDLWPSTGDYDFNDLSFSYRSLVITNAQNKAVQVDLVCNVNTNYAGFTNAIGIELEGISPSQIQSITGTNYTENYLSFNGNGTEANQDNAVIIFTDNADNYLQETTVSIVFNSPISTDVLGAAPFNPFIIANKDRGKEIHLPGYHKTNLSDGGTYITGTGFPWGLSIINDDFKVPKEGINIMTAYNHFANWAISGGTEHVDWHSNKNPGYRNDNMIED